MRVSNDTDAFSYAKVIRQARASRGLNQEALASLIGVSRNTVASWETAHSRPDLDTVPLLCKALHLSLSAFFGIRAGDKATARQAEDQSLLAAFRSLGAEDRKILLWEAEALAAHRAASVREAETALPAPVGNEVSFPLVSCFESDLDAAAGFGSMLEGASGKRIWLRKTPLTAQADEVIRVSGHSMEPTFPDGSRVLVHHCSSIRPGEIGIFISEGVGYIKEYQPDGLHSHNPDYPVMKFGPRSSVLCAGKVLGLLEDGLLPTEEQLSNVDDFPS